jgi:hypothetical protein
MVRSGDFVCIIDPRDASTSEEALREAADPLTRWYFTGDNLSDALAGFETAKRIDHNEFCDWLRRGKHSFTMREAREEL